MQYFSICSLIHCCHSISSGLGFSRHNRHCQFQKRHLFQLYCTGELIIQSELHWCKEYESFSLKIFLFCFLFTNANSFGLCVFPLVNN